MKSIQYFLWFITCLTVIDAYAQLIPNTYPGKVSTPNGSQVDVKVWQSGDWNTAQKDSLKNYYLWYYGNKVSCVGEATFKYNCHTFTWDGSPNVWMDNPDQYWLDQSYKEIYYQTVGAKVFYGNGGNHSAIVTALDTFTSKWGELPLFKHSMNVDMYNTSELHYYLLASTPPQINGPTTVYTSDTFRLSPLPLKNNVIIWAVSNASLFTVVSNANNTATVTRKGTGNATLYAYADGHIVAQSPINASSTPPSPTINGSTLICTGSPQNFFVTGAPAGFTWSKSSNLNLSSTTSTSISVSAVSGSSGAGWVSVNQGGTELKRFNVWVGTPLISTINGPHTVQVDDWDSFTAVSASGSANANISSYQWYLSGTSGVDWYIWGSQTGPTINITFYNSGAYSMGVKAINSCGTPQHYYYVVLDVDSRRSSGSFGYPNPVDDVLFVDLDAFAAANSSSQSFGTRPTYDVRLYDMMGNMLRQQIAGSGTVRFDVSSLPNGFYYLHIYDGISSTPEIQKIIVQH